MQTPKELLPLFFGIEKVKATDFAPDLQFSPSLTHLILADTGKGKLVVNACSKNYELISNRELIMPFYKKIYTEHEVKLQVRQFGYSKFYIDFIVTDRRLGLQGAKKDSIHPRIRLNNSYDGSVKYSFDYGFYRLVCTNGLMVPVKDKDGKNIMSGLKLMHTPRAGDGRALELTMESVEKFLKNSAELLRVYDPLLEKKMKMDEAIKRMEEIKEECNFPARSMEIAANQLNKEVSMGLPINDFLVYNAMNYALHHNPESQMKTHKADKIDRRILNFLLEN